MNCVESVPRLHLRSSGLSGTCRRTSWCHRSRTPAANHLSEERSACSWDLPTSKPRHQQAISTNTLMATAAVAPLTFTATDWACRSQGGRMGRGRVTSQYAVREAKAPKPSSEEGDRVREDSEKEGRGRDGRRLHKSSDSDPLSPALERSDCNHSWKCITEGTEVTEHNSDPTPSR